MIPTMYVSTFIPAGEIRVPFYEQKVSDLAHNMLCDGARIVGSKADGTVILEKGHTRFVLEPA